MSGIDTNCRLVFVFLFKTQNRNISYKKGAFTVRFTCGAWCIWVWYGNDLAISILKNLEACQRLFFPLAPSTQCFHFQLKTISFPLLSIPVSKLTLQHALTQKRTLMNNDGFIEDWIYILHLVSTFNSNHPCDKACAPSL